MDREPNWIPRVLLSWVLLAGLLWALVWLFGDGRSQLSAHEEFPSLLVGGDGALRIRSIFGFGVALAFVQVGFLATAFLAGYRRRVRGKILRVSLAAAAIHLASFAALFVAYRGFMLAPTAAFVGPFPTPTLLLLFVLWPAPLAYLWIFLRNFDQWMPDAELEARLTAHSSSAAPAAEVTK